MYAELSDLAPAAAEDKPASYEPTDYADITHILTPKADLVYSNVAPRCSEEGAYANVQEMKKWRSDGWLETLRLAVDIFETLILINALVIISGY